ncbi:MAG: hypothetical protein U0931_09100 [Vulcanimicrobiota bacterium]
MASDEEDMPAWGGAIQSALSEAGDEEDEKGINVVSGAGLSADGQDPAVDLPYVILLRQAVAAIKAGHISDEEFVEGVSKLDVICDNALKVYAIPTVKKDLPGKLTEHQNEIVNSLEAELHRLKEGLGLLLGYPESKSESDLDEGLQMAVDAMHASAAIQKAADTEKAAIDARKKEEKARRAQAAEAEDADEDPEDSVG